MGYNTSHRVSITDAEGNDVTAQHIGLVAAQSGYDEDQLLDGEECKWYDENEDMLALSEQHPNLVFRVDGDGEESGDIWTHWYKAGQLQQWDADVRRPDAPPRPWA